MPHLEVWQLLEGRCLLEGGAYFNMDTQKCSAYSKKYGKSRNNRKPSIYVGTRLVHKLEMEWMELLNSSLINLALINYSFLNGKGSSKPHHFLDQQIKNGFQHQKCKPVLNNTSLKKP